MSQLMDSLLPDAVLRPAAGNSFEVTVEQLANAIRLGVFVDGQVLPPERELAERLGVSRNTLRDAIAALREAGLVTTRRGRNGGSLVTYDGNDPGRIAYLPDLGPAQVRDALTFRRIVEPGAAALAAQCTLTAQMRADLTQALEEATAADDPAGRRLADSRLHLAIATVSGSPLVVESVTRVRAHLGQMLAAIPVLGPNIAHSDEQHVEIVRCIFAGDAEGARVCMEEHCDATAALLRGLIG